MQSEPGESCELEQYGTQGSEAVGELGVTEAHKKQGSCSERCVLSHLLLVLLIVLRTGSTLASQIVTGTTNIFELSSLRFAVESLIVLCVALITKKSLLVRREHIVSVFGFALTLLVSKTALYFTASIWPIGSMEAAYIVIVIFFSTGVDLVTKRIPVISVIVSLLAITGVILLTQPWDTEGVPGTIQSVPCVYWEGERVDNHTLAQTSQANGSELSNETHPVKPYHITINNMVFHITVSPYSLGYILIVLASISGVFYSYISKHITTKLELLAVLFWGGIINCLCSLFANITWSLWTGAALYSFSSGWICCVFFTLFVLLASTSNLLFVAATQDFQVSKVVVTYVFITLVLYISQRTWLEAFQPGQANLLSEIGIVVIVCAFLIIPIRDMLHKYAC